MLSAIYVKGFKTFARPVRMPLFGGVTAIIGPNGSGKSNVTDAVLFALGEGSPSVLRVGSMGDLIFSGSDSLPAAGAAEVTLVMENASGRISLPYEEVSLTRRISRDGETEYRINGDRARLTDVRAVAGEAGLGRHSILRQGAVDSIVAGGAAACRMALEEAAGLGVFRRRRLAASRKLEKAATQLESSRRLEAELSAQLRRIEDEARAAREYRDLEARYRELSLAHLYRSATRRIDGGYERLEQLDAGVTTLQERREALQEEARRLTEEERELGDRISTTEEVLQRLEQGREALRDEAIRAERTLLRVEGDRGSATDHLRLRARLATGLEKISSEVRQLEGEADGLEEEHARKKEELGRQEELASRKRAEHVAAADRRARLSGNLEALNERRRRLIERLDASGEQHESLERLVGVREGASTFGSGHLRERAVALLGRLEGLRPLAAKKAEEAERCRGTLASLVGRTEAEVRALRAAGKKADGGRRLYEVLRPRRGYETAVEAALGELAGGVLAETLDEGLKLLTEDSLERVVVRLDAEEVPKNGRLPGKPLFDCVEILDASYSEAIGRLLDGVYLLAEPDRSGMRNGYVAVTREGLRFTRTSASRLSPGGDFSRQARLNREEERLDMLKNQLGDELYDLREAVLSTSRNLDDRTLKARSLDGLISRTSRIARLVASEAGRRARRAEAARERRMEDESDLQRVEAEIVTVERDLHSARGEEERAKKELYSALEASEAAYVASRETAGHSARVRTDLQRARGQRARLSRSLAGLRDVVNGENGRHADLARRAARDAGRLDEAARERLIRLRRSRSEAAGLQERAVAERLRLAGEAGELAERLASARTEAAAFRRSLIAAEEARAAAEAEISDEWGATLETAKEVAAALPQNIDVERERARLARKLKSFDDVNLLAISQEGELRERYEFVAAQRGDAEAAAAEIESIIRDVDREIEVRFEETFRGVQQAFGEMVPRMMEGAKGKLSLSEEGVEIGLRLKRRGWRPLRVLSGGERSLLALAFLFSVFLGSSTTVPSGAFCMLDEAEAALDDVNLSRFLAVVDSYRTSGQFLLVTHQKRTMAASDVLYGVTPDASGASVVVSKRLTGE